MDKIYFAGYRLEHFTSWNGTGIPSYYSLGTSMSSEQNSLGYISLSNNQVLWSNVTNNDFDPIFLTAECYHSTYNHFGNVYLCDTDNNIVGIGFNRNSDTYLTVNAWDGIYNGSSGFTSRTSLGSITETFNYQTARIYRFYLKLSSSNGKEYDTVETFYSSSANSYTLTSIGSYTLSTPLKNIKSSFCFKDTIYNTYGYATLFYLVVANFDLSNTYLDYTTASSIGSTNQWSGDVTSFSTYPVNYSSTGGMSSSTNNTSVSYNLSKTLNTTQVGSFPLAMVISSNDISSNSLYTNGYTGTYTISIPNYLASGTGISIVFYETGSTSMYSLLRSSTTNTRWSINDADSGRYSKNSFCYVQYNAGWADKPVSAINDTSWNNIMIFNKSGYLNIYLNGVYKATVQKTTFETSFLLNTSDNFVVASIAYINSEQNPTYPFDKASNVTSYIDFADPNNPVVYGDTSQLSVTSKSLNASTTIPNVPTIYITSSNSPNSPNSVISPFVTNGTTSITTSDTSIVTQNGNNSTFYLLEDPITNSDWTSNNIQKYQFGLTKID